MFRSISKNIEVNASDSGEEIKSSGGYLPGETLSLLTRKTAGMIEHEHSVEDKLG